MTLLNTSDSVDLGAEVSQSVYAGVNHVWPDWTPHAIPGLCIWLDASQLKLSDGSPVTVWPNHGSGSQPIFVSSPPPVMASDTPSGLSCVKFTQSQGALRMRATGVTIPGTLTYFARIGNNTGRMVCGIYPDAANWIGGCESNVYDYFYDGGPQNSNFKSFDANGHKWKLYSFDWSSPTDHIWQDGNLISAFSSAGGTGPNNMLALSGYDAGGTADTCDFEMCELIAYNHVLTDTDRQRVESYLRSKWSASKLSGIAGAILADSPVAYYRLGDDFSDMCGGPNASVNGHITQGPSLLANGEGMSSVFDGSGSLVVPDSPPTELGNHELTVEAFVITNGSGGYRTLIDDASRSLSLFLESLSSWYIGIGGAGGSIGFSPGAFVVGQPTHCVVTVDASTQLMTTYLNGVAVSPGHGCYPGGNVAHGFDIGGNPSGGGGNWYGSIQEFALYNYALSPSQIQSHYQVSQ